MDKLRFGEKFALGMVKQGIKLRLVKFKVNILTTSQSLLPFPFLLPVLRCSQQE